MFAPEEWEQFLALTKAFLLERGAMYGPVSYSAVNGMLGVRTGRNFDLSTWKGQNDMSRLLAEVNDQTLPEIEAVMGRRVLLSTLVMRKGGSDVGKGYYSYAWEHGLLRSRTKPAKDAFLVEQLQLIREYCRRVRGSASEPDEGLPLASS